MADSLHVDDGLWAVLEPLLPERLHQRIGRPRVDDRIAFTAILFVLVTGVPWRLLPREFDCSGLTAWRRLRDWGGCPTGAQTALQSHRSPAGRFGGLYPTASPQRNSGARAGRATAPLSRLVRRGVGSVVPRGARFAIRARCFSGAAREGGRRARFTSRGGRRSSSTERLRPGGGARTRQPVRGGGPAWRSVACIRPRRRS
jgi:transposase